MKRRVLALEAIERNAGAVRFKIAEQSHFGDGFCRNNTPTFKYPFFEHGGIKIRPGNGGLEWDDRGGCLWVLANGGSRNEPIICSEEIYDNKIVPAVSAYNKTNGGCGLEPKSCPRCGFEMGGWVPKEGETYAFIAAHFRVYHTISRGSSEDQSRIDAGNYFRDTELAEKASKEIQATLRRCEHGK